MNTRLGSMLLALTLGCGGGDSSDGSGETSTESPTDPIFVVDVYDSSKAFNGATFFADTHDPSASRIVEVDMNGTVVWEYVLPESITQGKEVNAMDVEYLSDTRRVLFNIMTRGIYEISYDTKEIAWSWTVDDDPLAAKTSHDVDRVEYNGAWCTLYVWGMGDKKPDAQVRMIDSSGAEIWSWKAQEHSPFNAFPYTEMGDDASWTHINGVELLPNKTYVLVSLRNFHLTALVNTITGSVDQIFDLSGYSPTGTGVYPHGPDWEGTSPPRHLIGLQNDSPYAVVEVQWKPVDGTWTENWTYPATGLRTTRDANRLGNDNILIVSVLRETDESILREIAPDGQTVWQLRLANAPATRGPGFFFSAQRVGL